MSAGSLYDIGVVSLCYITTPFGICLARQYRRIKSFPHRSDAMVRLGLTNPGARVAISGINLSSRIRLGRLLISDGVKGRCVHQDTTLSAVRCVKIQDPWGPRAIDTTGEPQLAV